MLSLCALGCLVQIALCAAFISTSSTARPFSFWWKGGRALWQICNVWAWREKDIDSLYNRGNKSAHSVPAGSFIISQERKRERGQSEKVREREKESSGKEQ